jgi:hypothetical protein
MRQSSKAATATAVVVVGLLLPSLVLGFTSIGSPLVRTRNDVILTTTTTTTQKSSSSSSSLNAAALLFSPSILSVAGSVAAAASAASADSSSSLSVKDQREHERTEQIKKQGGLFTVRTKYGAINPYAIYYGTVAIVLGIPWFLALTLYQLFAFVTRDKLDKNRIIPVLITHVWGTLLLTRSYPTIENQQVLDNFFKE